jgi:hypothetical protein
MLALAMASTPFNIPEKTKAPDPCPDRGYDSKATPHVYMLVSILHRRQPLRARDV